MLHSLFAIREVSIGLSSPFDTLSNTAVPYTYIGGSGRQASPLARNSHYSTLVGFDIVHLKRSLRVDVAQTAIGSENTVFGLAADETIFTGGARVIADSAGNPVRV